MIVKPGTIVYKFKIIDNSKYSRFTRRRIKREGYNDYTFYHCILLG